MNEIYLILYLKKINIFVLTEFYKSARSPEGQKRPCWYTLVVIGGVSRLAAAPGYELTCLREGFNIKFIKYTLTVILLIVVPLMNYYKRNG